jgi:hypothetical protein
MCLFVAKYIAKDDSGAEITELSEDDKGKGAEQKRERAPPVPLIVAHTGSLGSQYGSAGMAGDGGRLCYFMRTVDGPVNKDVVQDLAVVFGELAGDSSACIGAMLSNLTKPVCESLGVVGKSSGAHLADFMKSLGRLTQELDETAAAMTVTSGEPCFCALSRLTVNSEFNGLFFPTLLMFVPSTM